MALTLVRGVAMIRTRLVDGVYEALVTGPEGDPPVVTASHFGAEVPGVSLVADGPGRWRLRMPVPAAAIADGVQTIVFRSGDQVIDSLTFIAGDALEDDLRAEVALLRAELDLLKRAFRTHCAETR